MRCLTGFLVVLWAIPLWAQEGPRELKEKAKAAFRELEEECLTLYVINALNKKPVPGAVVKIVGGEYKTDEEGKICFPIPEDGTYRAQVSAEGYEPTSLPVEVMAGTAFVLYLPISPKLEIDQARIVLVWGKKPKDLDAHLVCVGRYHISYRDMRKGKEALLDIDCRDGRGPETITLTRIDPEEHYIYYVHDYTNRNKPRSKGLSKNSHATVILYAGDRQWTFTVPRGIRGTVWKVFEIVDGKVVPCEGGCVGAKMPE